MQTSPCRCSESMSQQRDASWTTEKDKLRSLLILIGGSMVQHGSLSKVGERQEDYNLERKAQNS